VSFYRSFLTILGHQNPRSNNTNTSKGEKSKGKIKRSLMFKNSVLKLIYFMN
jgi:hypothetical protein